MSLTQHAERREDAANLPIVWFFELEDAREHGDFERAAKAQKELKRLGVDVHYRPQREVGHVP